MTFRKTLVDRAIAFGEPERVPIVFWNRDQTQGDVMLYHLSLGVPGDGDALANVWDWSTNEWGYHLNSLKDGTMGHFHAADERPASADATGPAGEKLIRRRRRTGSSIHG